MTGCGDESNRQPGKSECIQKQKIAGDFVCLVELTDNEKNTKYQQL